MMTKKSWAVFCSQTGTEIVNLCCSLIHTPQILITNNSQKLSEQTVDFCRQEQITIISIPNKPSIDDYVNLHLYQYDIITLHGYLRIIPVEQLMQHNIYNGHPGLITQYPELKGKDPQIRMFQNIEKYPYCGSVVHKVIQKVDEGEIMTQSHTSTQHIRDLSGAFTTLRETSIKAWMEFLKPLFLQSKS